MESSTYWQNNTTVQIEKDLNDSTLNRRELFSNSIFGVTLSMAYGLFAWCALRFLQPLRENKKAKMFVAYLDDVPPGGSHSFQTAKGEKFLLTRSTDDHLTAFSSRCPHLGCKVNWEAEKKQFFCPCHEGVFDSKGVGIGGPPKGLVLKSCEIILKGKALYAMVDP